MSQRRDWSRRTEAASLQGPAALLKEARANSDAAKDPALLALLAHEVAVSRGAELTLAYRNVIAVAAGFRRRRHGAGQRLTREPCVVFVVRNKWDRDEHQADHPQHLPRWLVTFAERDGLRQPFALPTDVQHETGFSGARAHGSGAVWTERPGLPREFGALACAVDVTHSQGTLRCVLSAQHVLTPRPDVESMRIVAGLPLKPLDAKGDWLDQPTLATSVEIGGLLRGEQDPDRPSFDVQLASADDVQELRSRLGAPRLNPAEPIVTSATHLFKLATQTQPFEMIVPANHPDAPGRAPIKLRLDALLPAPFAIDYEVCRGDERTHAWIFHEQLLKLAPAGSRLPIAGDSGSALVWRHGDGTATLVGLYIGGADGGAFAIPAWQLFDLTRYWTHPAGARLTPASL